MGPAKVQGSGVVRTSTTRIGYVSYLPACYSSGRENEHERKSLEQRRRDSLTQGCYAPG